jgi:hypothetical protein
MKHEQIQSEYFKSLQNYDDDSFYTSQNYKENDLFINHPDAVQVNFYVDDFGTADALKDTKNLYRITGVYFKIGNLPGRFQGTNHFTQLIYLCFPEDVKRLGYEETFQDLLKDLSILETEGVNIERNNQLINLKGTITFMVTDNLAANGIGGYVESFGCNMSGYCRQCLADSDTVQLFTRDKDFQARSKETNTQDLNDLQRESKRCKTIVHINGVKSNSMFKNLLYFSIIDSLPPDILHDFLEGVIPKNFSCLLKYFIDNGMYSIEELNLDLKNFKYQRIDGANKIPADFFTKSSITSFKLSGI